MKRRTLLALAASTVLLAACGQSNTNEADTTSASKHQNSTIFNA